MNSDQKELVKFLIKEKLNEAEILWKKKGAEMVVNENLALDSLSLESRKDSEFSKIPGHPIVSLNTDEVCDFVALVADMRMSSEHLLCEISKDKADVSMLQRVYYETSALLPALSLTISFEGGAVTEYLGDGVLALFRVPKSDDNELENIEKTIKKAYRAAKDCIEECRILVNEALKSRFRLPSLDIGVGLAYSPALITLIGIENNRQAKAFGECIFRATKLSCGVNKIYIDEKIKAKWPKNRINGIGLSFKPREINRMQAYVIDYKNR